MEGVCPLFFIKANYPLKSTHTALLHLDGQDWGQRILLFLGEFVKNET